MWVIAWIGLPFYYRYCWSNKAFLLSLNAWGATKLLQWSYSWGRYFIMWCNLSVVWWLMNWWFMTLLFLSCRPKLKHIQSEVQENVKRMMSEQLHIPFTGLSGCAQSNSRHFTKPSFIASCSVFGPKVCFFFLSAMIQLIWWYNSHSCLILSDIERVLQIDLLN